MTENELEDLLDSLVNLENDYDTLRQRVETIELSLPPKGAYFAQLKASFENSPECCTDVVSGCSCPDSTPTAVFHSSSDGEDISYIEINELRFNNLMAIPVSIASYTRENKYPDDAANQWTLTFENNSNVSLCIKIHGFDLTNYGGQTELVHPDNTNPTVVVNTADNFVSFCLAVA